MRQNRIAIINGISGQDGAYLAQYLLSIGYRVYGITRRQGHQHLFGLQYLHILDKIEIIYADVSDAQTCYQLINHYPADEFYNLGAQSSVSYSFEYPTETIQYNILSVLNLLESIRKINPEIKFYQASSSEMYGKVFPLPVARDTPLYPVSPYGISKATGHWLVSQYREAYGLYAVSGVLYNHESFLRPDSFFVKKVISSALRIAHGLQDNLHVGNLNLKRDFGFAREYVKAIWLMLQNKQAQDLQVCSGVSVSLQDIVYYIFNHFNLDLNLIIPDKNLFRPAEIIDIYGDNTEIKNLGWKYDYTFFDILDILMEEEKKNLLISI